ncbi:MAG: sialate O-acetylesterase [Rhodanobacteraceae bacterium]
MTIALRARNLPSLICADILLAVLLVIARPALAADNPSPLMNVLFQDHAVLQHDRMIPVWGHAKPGEAITVSIDGEQARAHAGADGHWQVQLSPLHAGGPYTLAAVAADGSQQAIHDVLVGDVWLCAGQSNMQLPVHRTLNSRAVIANAHSDTIRMLSVTRRASASPRTSLAGPVAWEKTTPQTVGDFSAACYYFARDLQKKVHVPMGLINASWGGSRMQAWMSAKALKKVGGYARALGVLAQYAKDPLAANASWAKVWEAWWHGLPGVAQGDEPWNPNSLAGPGWHPAPAGLGGWDEWGVPQLARFTGMVWFRSKVELSAKQAAEPAVLSLGTVDEIDETWVNGRAIGSTYIGAPRNYRLPRGLLHAGTNLIAVNVLNTYRDGGLIGPASTRALHFADGTSVPLDRAWTYRIVPASAGMPPVAPWLSAPGTTTLYNAMIAPLGHYAVRGEIWYQGASNTANPGPYATLLRAYRTQVRAQFGAHLPFLIVQLAGYGPGSTRPGPSDWARLREAQRKVAADDPHSGLAVQIDIGHPHFIHPADKQALGQRLVRVALHVAYGDKTLPPSGPIPLWARHEHGAVAVRFGDITGGLVAYSASAPIGFELCGTQPGSCHYADARIKGDEVILHAANASQATRVRYAWADRPVVNLFDKADLPAGPFEIPIR